MYHAAKAKQFGCGYFSTESNNVQTIISFPFTLCEFDPIRLLHVFGHFFHIINKFP